MLVKIMDRYSDYLNGLKDLYPERSIPPDAYGQYIAARKRKKYKKRNNGRK